MLFETGHKVQFSDDYVKDPENKITSYIGRTGIVLHAVLNERGKPSEYITVYWKHLNAFTVFHSDCFERVK